MQCLAKLLQLLQGGKLLYNTQLVVHGSCALLRRNHFSVSMMSRLYYPLSIISLHLLQAAPQGHKACVSTSVALFPAVEKQTRVANGVLL